jgi:hypothetical protein
MTVPVFNSEQRLSLLIHAQSKVGKSTLSSTAPQPILVLDAEGSWRFIPVRKTYWDPAGSAPPQADGTWDVCIVTVREWRTIELVYQWLLREPTSFTSIVLDSISEVQRRCRANLKGIEAMRIQDWGVLLSVMDQVIRGFRDLTLIESSVRCVVFVAETRPDTRNANKFVPYMQGQISDSLPYWVDICGFLYADNELDANGQPTEEVRRLYIGPHPQFESGERVWGRLGTCLTIHKPPVDCVGTDITDWMRIIYGLDSQPTT